MQNVLITGASSGIGLAIALTLQADGYQVWGTSRTPEAYQHQVPFPLLPLDVTSEASVQKCKALFFAQAQKIDILINNAGTIICGSAEETSYELAHKQFQTNFWGAVYMTKAFLPAMRQRKEGRIITIGSLAGLIGVPFESFYAASKHAVEGFFKSLRFELRTFNIRVSVIEPGFFHTRLYDHAEFATPHIPDYDATRTNALSVIEHSGNHAPPPKAVAQVVQKVLASKNPRFSYRVGTDAKLLPVLQFTFSRLFEMGAAKKFKV